MLSVCAEVIVPTSPYGWMEWDVTNHVNDAIREELSNVNFLIKTKGELLENNYTTKYFYSANNSDTEKRPKLLIDENQINSMADVWLYQNSPTTNMATGINGNSLSVNNRNGRQAVSLITFPLDGSIKKIGSALLYLYFYNQAGTQLPLTVQVNKLTQPDWVETESTWNIYKTGSNWTTAGGDYVTEVEDLPSGHAQRIWPAEYPRLYP